VPQPACFEQAYALSKRFARELCGQNTLSSWHQAATIRRACDSVWNQWKLRRLVPDSAIETLGADVLDKLSRPVEMLSDTALMALSLTDEFWAIISGDHRWLSALSQHCCQQPGDICTDDPDTDMHDQTLPREVVHHVQDAESLTRSQLSRHELRAPALMSSRTRPLLPAFTRRQLVAGLTPHCQPLSPIDPVHPFMVHRLPCTLLKDVQATVAKARPFQG